MSVFGNLNAGNKPSLFGSLGSSQNQQSQPQQTSSIFGNSTSQPQQQPGSNLFGNLGGSTSQPQQQQQQQPGSNLFGNLGGSTSQPQQQQSSNLFSGFGQQQAPQQSQGGSLFGASTQPANTNSLFGASNQPAPSTNPFGSTQQSQQNAAQPQQGSVFGNFGTSTQNQPAFGGGVLGASQNQPAFQQSRLGWNPASSVPAREKTIPEQMETLLHKWSPSSPQCALTTYFYNSVPPDTLPYFSPPPNEDAKAWEAALAAKPTPGSVPVSAHGFAALGDRLRVQVGAVTALQARLHEINNSLAAMRAQHELATSVRAADARRRHTALGQRCLALAARVQVLRNRGYAMDGAEEALRKRLVLLERGVCDPGLGGRQEEIWARMVSTRERARVLQEEAEKMGERVRGGEEGLDEEVIVKTKKILSDYDSQLAHLKKEIDEIRKEFEDWEKSTKPGAELNGD
ncbi:MAG: hypothetical protein M1821_005645 [Bathelium mastoideum]|nr:MAG: hypothetical protein M1821_005645 [Bathelium mastoideum]